MKRFKIVYIDPRTDQRIEVVKEFKATAPYTYGGQTYPPISALEWAEDYAYTAADKGWYSITEMKGGTDDKVRHQGTAD